MQLTDWSIVVNVSVLVRLSHGLDPSTMGFASQRYYVAKVLPLLFPTKTSYFLNYILIHVSMSCMLLCILVACGGSHSANMSLDDIAWWLA